MLENMRRLELKKPSPWWGVWETPKLSANGVRYVSPHGGQEVNSLPVEFAFREFLELNPLDEEKLSEHEGRIASETIDENALVAFMNKWGALWHPYRFSSAFHTYYNDAAEIEREVEKAETAGAIYKDSETRQRLGRALHEQHVHAVIKASDGILLSCDPDDPMNAKDAEPCHGLLSLEEACLAALDMQMCIQAILAFDTYEINGDPTPALELINEGATRETYLVSTEGRFMDETGYPRDSWQPGCTPARTCLTNEICNQVLAVIGSDTEWKQCECEGCGRWFKEKRGGAKTSNKKGSREPIYCSKQCNDRAAKRKQREREKAARQADAGSGA